jgi:hypothetical protein
MRSVAFQMGGTLKVGRRRETVSPLAWDPPYLGSQRSLVPDMILELEGRSFITCHRISAQSRILALESAVSLKSRVPVYTSVSATTASAGWRPSEELLYSGAPSLSE